MNHFQRRDDGALYCENVSLAAIAAAIGTPVYVYSSATLERHFTVFAQAFAPEAPLIAFAVKANSNLAVLRTLAALGAGADTVSAGEIARAVAAGIPPQKIIFSGVGKTAEELDYAIQIGVSQINVESAAELALLSARARAANQSVDIALRINPDVGAGGNTKIITGGAEAKFGVGAAEALGLYAQAASDPHLNPVGLAVHIGSQIKDLAPFRAAFTRLRALVLDLRKAGLPVSRLDLGGGLGAPYFNEAEPPSPLDYAAMVREQLGDLDCAWVFEPGRLIAANAGILLARVLRRQQRPQRSIIVLDAGMNDLIRPALYEAFHDVQPVAAPAGPAAPCDLVGPVCETGDTFALQRSLPPLNEGDLVAFMTAGAYGAVMASTYNSRALVPEVLVRGDQFALVRRRWPIEAQLALEPMPDWLKG